MAPDPSHSTTPLIIVLDPFRDEAEMYAYILRLAGFEPALCEDAEIALAKALNPRVAAVITRILQRGKVDGIEFTRRLKRDHKTRHVPVLVISTHTHPLFRQAAKEAGCDAFVLLPCMPDVIVSELQRMTGDPADRRDSGSDTTCRPPSVMHGGYFDLKTPDDDRIPLASGSMSWR